MSYLSTISTLVVGAVWIFHGLYSKILNGLPRHRLIVARILGQEYARLATRGIGLLEVALGIWVLSGYLRAPCAIVQTAALVAMNTLEIVLAGDLLISGPGMVLLNCALVALAWYAALSV